MLADACRAREVAQSEGRKGHFVVDLSTPTHLTSCLATFQVPSCCGRGPCRLLAHAAHWQPTPA